MITLYSDLDNTLIYSIHHDFKEPTVCIEELDGKPFSFMIENDYNTFSELMNREDVCIVPLTSRSLHQVKRLDFKQKEFPYLLYSNGGCLLTNGEFDEDWYNESLSLIENCKAGLELARSYLLYNPKRIFEVRFIDNLWLFTKISDTESAKKDLETILNPNLFDIQCKRNKIYVIPKVLDKAYAIKRLENKLQSKVTIAGGDSDLDVSMFREVNIGVAPTTLGLSDTNVVNVDSEFISTELLNQVYFHVDK